jgi:hypothetical protein
MWTVAATIQIDGVAGRFPGGWLGLADPAVPRYSLKEL